MKLAVFDFDSTLMDGETIDYLASKFGVENEVSKITKLAMNGELDFFESIMNRVQLLKGLDYSSVLNVCENLPLMPGAVEIIKKLKENNYKIVCFSGGFRIATSYAKKVLDFDADFANILHHKNDLLTGNVGGDMMFNHSKGDMIQRLQSLLNISKNNTLVVGDGANDISMFKHASTRIAFCAKDILKKEANIIINKKNLMEIEKELKWI